MRRALLITLFGVLVGVFGSCKDDPVTPPTPGLSVTIQAPKTGQTLLPYTFYAKLSAQTQTRLRYAWIENDSTLSSSNPAQLAFGNGTHVVSVEVHNADNGSLICSSMDTFVASGPELGVTVLSGDSIVGDRHVFRAIPTAGSLPSGYTMQWSIGGQTETRSNADTVSWRPSSPGAFTIGVLCKNGASQSVFGGAYTIRVRNSQPTDTISHAFSWTEYRLPTTYVTEDNATACWVFSANNILVCNWYLYRFDGQSFSKFRLDNGVGGEVGALSGSRIFAFNPNDFWIGEGSIFYHWDGSRANQTRLENTGVWHYPEDGGMNALWGTSSTDMFFVGDKGTILHFDGTNWIKYPRVTDLELLSIWGTSHNNVWACGYDQTTTKTALLHFDGASWQVDAMTNQPTSETGGFSGVWAADSAGATVAVAVGSILHRKTNSGDWLSDSLSHLNDTHIGLSVTGNSPNDLLIAGGWGLVMHWNGQDWRRYDELYAPSAVGYTTHDQHMKGNTVCIVGKKNGTSWVAIGQR